MSVAVMGAAGHVGGKVADILLGEGVAVRALTHRRELPVLAARGADVMAGDAVNVNDMRRFVADVDAALVLLPEQIGDPQFSATRSRIAEAVVRALEQEGTAHVVALSSLGTDQLDAAGPPVGLREFEDRLGRLQATNVVVLRSASYMDYLLGSLPLIRSQRINGSAIGGDVRIPMVATQDVAREAAMRLQARDVRGHHVRELLGPQDMTMREATSAIGAAIGVPDTTYVELPPEAVREALRSAGFSEESARLVVEMQLALNAGWPSARRTPDNTAPTRFSDFLAAALPMTSVA